MVAQSGASIEYEDYEEDNYRSRRRLFCYCKGHCPSGDESGICSTAAGGKCFSVMEVLEDDNGEDYYLITHGCFGPGGGGLMQCMSKQLLEPQGITIECCEKDFCNKDLIIPPPKTTQETNYFKSLLFVTLSSAVATFFVALLIMTIIFLLCRRRAKRANTNDERREEGSEEILMNRENVAEANILFDLVDRFRSSGSGLPVMLQRTVAKQLEREALVGEGRFGEVWQARFNEEKLAVKVFLSKAEKSWFRETEVYQTVLMKHENILEYIGADIRANGSETELSLITAYHERGSLYNFLQSNTLNPDSLLMMCTSIAKGLTFLHTEAHEKPAIAHRDITSKSILVKTNGECCICDLGMAVKYDSLIHRLDIPITDRRVTKRYMAPEVLDNKIDLENFVAYKQTDMYACGLVFWEMARRCQVGDNNVPPYDLPYYANVPPDPTIEQMYEAVTLKKIRPVIDPSWNEVKILQTVAKIMQELWHDNPGVRLTSLRVQKTLNKLEKPRDVSIEEVV